MIEAFEKYHTSNGVERAAPYIKESGKMASQHGLTIQDKARLDAVGGHAILANTIPTAFWTLYHILSDPAVLEEVQEAVTPLVSSAEMEDGSWKHEIDISKIRDVPILKSVLYEALRHYGSGTGARIVVEDTMLDDRYMLKKGAFIFMPNRLYHFNREAWGDDVDAFDAHRFTGKRQHHPGAFRGFGGGANLCPGRFFAMNEILACCAMLVLRFDVRPSRTGGAGERWTHPGVDGSNMSLIVNPPKGQVYVDVVERAGWRPGTWSFKL
jgi:cytochrome P450